MLRDKSLLLHRIRLTNYTPRLLIRTKEFEVDKIIDEGGEILTLNPKPPPIFTNSHRRIVDVSLVQMHPTHRYDVTEKRCEEGSRHGQMAQVRHVFVKSVDTGSVNGRGGRPRRSRTRSRRHCGSTNRVRDFASWGYIHV